MPAPTKTGINVVCPGTKKDNRHINPLRLKNLVFSSVFNKAFMTVLNVNSAE